MTAAFEAATTVVSAAAPAPAALAHALGGSLDQRLLFGSIKVAVAIRIDLVETLLRSADHLILGEETVAIGVLLLEPRGQ